jgi:hypothetical protein
MTYNENFSFKLKHKTKLVSSNLLLMENLGVFLLQLSEIYY